MFVLLCLSLLQAQDESASDKKARAAELLARLQETRGHARYELENALRNLGLEHVRDLLPKYLIHPKANVRASAWDLMVDLDPDLPVAYLKHDDAEVRLSAVWALTFMARRSDAKTFVSLLSDSSPEVRRAALEGIADSGARECIPAVAERLGDPHVSGTAIETLVTLEARSYAGRIASMLKGSPGLIRAMGTMGARNHAADLLPFFQFNEDRGGWDPRPDVMAAWASMGAIEQRELIEKVLKDPQSRTCHVEALAALSLLGATDVALLRPLIEDRHVALVDLALRELAWIGTDEAVALIESKLGGAEAQAEARRALLLVGRADVVPRALGAFDSPDEDESRWFADALARWTTRGLPLADREGLLEILERREHEGRFGMKGEAQSIRVGLGVAPPQSLLPYFRGNSEGTGYRVLSYVHAKESFPKLYLPFVVDRDVGSGAELKKVMKEQWEVALDVDDTYYFQGTVRKGTRTSGMRLIDQLWRCRRIRRSYIPTTGFIVDKGVIRIVLEEDANEFWSARLKQN